MLRPAPHAELTLVPCFPQPRLCAPFVPPLASPFSPSFPPASVLSPHLRCLLELCGFANTCEHDGVKPSVHRSRDLRHALCALSLSTAPLTCEASATSPVGCTGEKWRPLRGGRTNPRAEALLNPKPPPSCLSGAAYPIECTLSTHTCMQCRVSRVIRANTVRLYYTSSSHGRDGASRRCIETSNSGTTIVLGLSRLTDCLVLPVTEFLNESVCSREGLGAQLGGRRGERAGSVNRTFLGWISSG